MRIEIKEPLAPVNNPTNVFKLVVSNMHGDADLYTTTDNYFYESQEARLIEVIKFLDWCRRPRRDEISNKWNDLLNKFDEEDGEDGEGLLYDMIEYDSTADNEFLCRPEFKRLTYFNESGVECKVDVIK